VVSTSTKAQTNLPQTIYYPRAATAVVGFGYRKKNRKLHILRLKVVRVLLFTSGYCQLITNSGVICKIREVWHLGLIEDNIMLTENCLYTNQKREVGSAYLLLIHWWEYCCPFIETSIPLIVIIYYYQFTNARTHLVSRCRSQSSLRFCPVRRLIDRLSLSFSLSLCVCVCVCVCVFVCARARETRESESSIQQPHSIILK